MDKETLYNFFNGDATLEQEVQVLAWLDEKPEHHNELLKERKLFDATLLLAKENSLQNRKQVLIPSWVKEVIKVAAVILITVGLGFYFVTGERNKLLALTNTIKVPAGQRVNITLPDGTKVCMNSHSELQYPTFFAGKNRKVKLKGEAFFDVTHNADMPFIVETNKYNVEVLGTTFDVEAYTDKKEFSTSLLRGKVKVTNNKFPEKEIILYPNEQVYTVNNKLAVRQIPDIEAFNWRDGILSFNGDSFIKLMGKLEKCYDLKIVIRCPAPQKEFIGKIRISDGIDHALKVLQKNTPFTYKWDDNRRVIYIK
ncbi:FecR family protein [uncultured Bacteroides sp.]|uniref:FecR family protein n=1 Tax=uncultured Bacteroides sp. TaxID=162156 RepID=UPI002AAB9426|nr:FecR family protein [uncultured Bacteroides sp.]